MNDKDTKFICQGTPNGNDALQFNADTGFAINVFGGAFTNCFDASAWRDIILMAIGTGTVVVHGSTQRQPVDFNAASTINNAHVPIALADISLVTSNYIAGATGVVVAGATKMVELNTNLLTWIGIHRSVNTVDVIATKTNAQ